MQNKKNDLLLAWRRIFYVLSISCEHETLNQLNKNLQGPGSNIILHIDAINVFVAKLKLCSERANNDNFGSFHHLTEITGDDFEQNLKKDIISHLQNWQNEFERYFLKINTSSILMKVARNPFVCKVENVPEAIQQEFMELTNNSFAKDEFHTCNLDEFWVEMQRFYSQLGIYALNILVPFSSTYLCECGFSALLTIKSKARNRLDVESDIRCALSTISFDIEQLVAKKQGGSRHIK